MKADPFIAIDQEEARGGAVPVGIAREQMRAAIDLFVEQALRFHATPAPEPGVIDLNYEPALHAALKFTTGGGKSEQMRQGAARFVLEQKRRGHQLYRVIFPVPTHRLAEEASNKMLAVFGDHGISTAIYQSREAKDLKTGEPLCRNLEAVKAALSVGLDVQQTCCKKGKIKCRFFDDCAFQRQRELAKKADVVFAAHELTAYPVREHGHILRDKTNKLRDTIEQLQVALMQMPDGRLTRQGLIDGGFLPEGQFYPVHFGLDDPLSGYRP